MFPCASRIFDGVQSGAGSGTQLHVYPKVPARQNNIVFCNISLILLTSFSRKQRRARTSSRHTLPGTGWRTGSPDSTSFRALHIGIDKEPGSLTIGVGWLMNSCFRIFEQEKGIVGRARSLVVSHRAETLNAFSQLGSSDTRSSRCNYL